MSDLHSKRRHAGEAHADKRRGRAPDVERLPPHKKPKTWGLSLTWTETVTRTMSQQFPSKAARDEARIRIERYFREKSEREKTRQRGYWGGYWNSPLSRFTEEKHNVVKEGPIYAETYEDLPDPTSGQSDG